MVRQAVVNPKQASGAAKPSMAAVPLTVLWELAAAMEEGARKYGRHNFRVSGKILASTYFNACCRHLFAWWEGEQIDPESGLPHIVKAMATLAILRDAQVCGTYEDDRPPSPPEGWWTEVG